MDALHGLSAIAAQMLPLQSDGRTAAAEEPRGTITEEEQLRPRPLPALLPAPSVSVSVLEDERRLLELELARRRRIRREESLVAAALEESSWRRSAVRELDHAVFAAAAAAPPPYQVPGVGGGGLPRLANSHHYGGNMSFVELGCSGYHQRPSVDHRFSFALQSVDKMPASVQSSAESLAHARVRAFMASAEAEAANARVQQAWRDFGAAQRGFLCQETLSAQAQQPGTTVQFAGNLVGSSCPGKPAAFTNGIIEYSKPEPSDSSARQNSAPQDEQAPAVATQAKETVSASASDQIIGTLFLPSDPSFLSEAHCFIRSSCTELFISSPLHVRAGGRGSRPSKAGQVGFRCVHCRDVPRCKRANQSTCFPSKRESVFECIRNFQRVHLEACTYIPDDIKSQYHDIVKRRRGPRRSQKLVRAYYAQSASEAGLVNTPSHGLEYREDRCRTRGKGCGPSEEMMLILRAAAAEQESSALSPPSGWAPKATATAPSSDNAISAPDDEDVKHGKFDNVASDETRQVLQRAKEERTPFVLPEDFSSISDFVYLLFHQLLPCGHTPATIKRRRLDPGRIGRNAGLPGLSCRHCRDESSGISGRYFPLSIESLGDSSFSQTLMVHLSGCPHVPPQVRMALEELKTLAQENRSCVKRGAKKIFAEKVWSRMEEIAKGGRDRGSQGACSEL